MKILSLGAGVQSSTMALMCEHGEIAKPDYAIFADTGWEPQHCYDWLDWLEQKLSYPVIRVSKGNIKQDLLKNIETGDRFSSIPFFTAGGGIVRRQCTNEYKLGPIQKKCRQLLGIEIRKRIKVNSVDMLIGISTDEAQRMKPSRLKWIANKYPLIDHRMSRIDCQSWMKNNGYPQPPKSSCVGCPYHSNQHWRDIKKNDPKSFGDACEIDEKLRSNGSRKNMKNEEYMHRSLKPLAEAFINNDETVDMFDEECEGMCGV